MAFNQSGTGPFNFSGLTLGGTLTIAGTGTTGLIGTSGAQAAGNLGTVSEAVGPARAITIAMAPTGVVALTPTATGWTGGTTVTGGTLVALNPGGSQKMFGANGVTLNGGTIRIQSGASRTAQDAITLGTAGGTLEGLNNNVGGGVVTHTFSAGLSGSAPVTLRYSGITTGSGTINDGIALELTGDNSGYTGNFTLATGNGDGNVRFASATATGGASSTVSAPAGVAFGFSSDANVSASILGKFTTTTNSILAVGGLTSIDLSLSGLNKDVRVGNQGNGSTVLPSLTPFGSTYNLTPKDNGTLSVAALRFTGATALNVAAPAVAPNAAGLTTGTLAITAAQDYTGNTTVAGTVRNSLIGGGGVTGTTLTTSADISGAGAITADNSATITILGTGGKFSGTLGITVKGGSTFNNGDTTTPANNDTITNRINSTATLTLGGASGGGTFRMAYAATGAAHAQTFSGLVVGAGANTINNVNTAAGTATLTFTNPAITNSGGLLNIASTFTNSVFALGGAPTLTTGNTFGGWLTINLSATNGSPGNFATVNGSNQIVAVGAVGATGVYTTQTNATFDDTLFNNTTNLNLDGTTPAFNKTLIGSKTINSLRTFGTANFNNITLTIPTAAILTIASGGIIGSGFVGSNAGIQGMVTIAGPGTLSSGTSDMYLYGPTQSIGNPLAINASINVNSGSGALFVRSGVIRLGGTANSFGDLSVLGATVIINAAGALPTTGTRSINLQAGTLQMSVGAVFGSGTTLNVSPAGGNLDVNGTSPVSFAGGVALNGALGFGSPSGGGATTTTLSGNVSGTGMIGIGKQADGKNTILLTGDNPNWTGGVRFDTTFGNSPSGNSHLRFSPAVAGYTTSGTGPILLASGNTPGGIYFDTTNAGSTTFSNDIVNNFAITPIVAWGLSNGLGNGTANTTTLSGKLVGNQGLFLQGYATGDTAISETVLSGAVSVSGTASGYSYGTATSAQNFNNGQGGITLGTTGFRSVTAQGTGNVGLPDLPVGQATNGAEGFVRFSGAQSFIPGAVGPGFIAAIRKAASGNDARFGYLLTGTGGGTAYALPEGKSFIIGSLGSGAQVGGTLGVAGGGTATLLGGAKAAAGQLLSGFNGGDINIHANAATDTQSLNLLARAAADTFVLGSISSPIVLTPTYGDSGITSAITLLSKRTGATTLNKIGAGTVDLAAVAYTHTDGTSAAAAFAWNVTAGTLQAPDGTSLANSVTISGGSTLKASGAITYTNAVTVGSGGAILDTNGNPVALGAVGGSGNMLTKIGNGTLDLNGAQTYGTLKTNGGTTNVNAAFTGGTVNANATTNFTVSQTLTALNIGTVPLAGLGGGAGLAVVPEPGSLGLLLVGALGLAARRRRSA